MAGRHPRSVFGVPEIDYTERTCIIVVEIYGSGGVVPMGIVVDGVSEVLNIKAGDIEDPPTVGIGLKAEYRIADC
jgi:purine-binding chemotaxis protein CheW